MNRRSIGITIIVIAGLLLLFIVYVIFFKKFNQPEQAQNQQQTVNTEAQLPKIEKPNDFKPVPVKPKTPEEMTQDDLKRLAMLFTERFGSFSNQSTFQNITDLEIFMTDRMKAWAEDFVATKNKETNGSGIYYGITTKAVTAEVKSFDNKSGRAEINVGTQRREATGTTNNATNFGQILNIKLEKVAGAWRVDEARWQDQKLK